ncbi:MAG: RNA-binding protein [Desulfobulbaceae bacterium]|nr:RNA-binding protein [Desulfobulbaceae bacterium]
MAQGKDFYGSTVTDAIAEACQKFSTTQDALDIEILETGSSGIFGLCRKKAHIRVTKKAEQRDSAKTAKTVKVDEQEEATEVVPQPDTPNIADIPDIPDIPDIISSKKSPKKGKKKTSNKKTADQTETAEAGARKDSKDSGDSGRKGGKKGPRTARRAEADQAPPELPAEQVLTEIQGDISSMLDLMGFPSTVTVTLKKYTVACHISDEYEEELVGKEGRTLDSLQYLVRKITSRRLPERIMLSLDVGMYRERRAEELEELALKLASQVREEGKTQAIPALNPSERRVVHMVLQEDKTIRSRSVGAGLFKKVLIYKPGKKKSYPRKGKGKKGQQGQQDERASDD